MRNEGLMKKKVLEMAVALVLILVNMSTNLQVVLAEDAVEEDIGVIESGISGDLSWTITSDGTLMISGVGDYAFDGGESFTNMAYSVPRWCDYADEIKAAVVDVKGITSTYLMFYGCSSITSVDIKNLDTSNVTDMRGMFLNCNKLKSLDMSKANTENVTDMRWMFRGCKSLSSIDIRNFNTTNVKSMAWMFADCNSLTNLDVSKFNTENVTEMYGMFADCRSLTSLNIRNFDTSNVTDMDCMFQHCNKLTSLDVSGFNTSNVTNMTWMFWDCSKLTSLDVSGFNTSNVISMCNMFESCYNLTKLDVSGFDTGKVKNISGMFRDCSRLTGLDVSNFNLQSAMSVDEIFFKCDRLEKLKMLKNVSQVIRFPQVDGYEWKNEKGVVCQVAERGLETSLLYVRHKKMSPTPTPDTPTPSNPTPATPSGTKVAAYNGDTFYLGDDGKLRCYDKNGKLVTNEFKFDGTYTYYMQADGTPMKDRLTYHPDGEHIIYLDTEGHEVFTNFQYCPSVDYICYFDSQGYLYKDQITFVGDKVYYLNANGALEQNGWFQFANGLDYGFANSDGTLVTTGFSYDPYGRVVFYHWNGMVARGLISDGVYYYSMDTTDGHYLGQFPVQ